MVDFCSIKDFEEKGSLSMHNSLPVILVVVWSDTSGSKWPGLCWVQSSFCCRWLKTPGVVETVIMMIEIVRKMPFLEPSPRVLHISPFFSLQDKSSIPGCIDGWVETEEKQRVPSAWFSHTVKHLSVLCLLWENTVESEHEIFQRKQPETLQQEAEQLWKHQPSTEDNQRRQSFARPCSL